MCAATQTDWRAHTHNSERGKKTAFAPQLPRREVTMVVTAFLVALTGKLPGGRDVCVHVQYI